MKKITLISLTLSLITSTTLIAKTAITAIVDKNITQIDNNLTARDINSTFDYKLKPKKVSKTVWCFLGALEGPSKKNAGNMVNTCYVKTQNSFVVVDSGPSYQYAKQAYQAMSKIASLPVKAVISTHDHDDHWLGNSFYKDKFNSVIIGPQAINKNYKASDETRMFRVLPENAIKGTKIIPVDITPNKSMDITIDGEEFEITPIGEKAHTQEDLFVYLPKQKVLFSGDLAMNGRITSNRDGSIVGELKAIKMMRSKDWTVFVAGHGLDTSKNALDDAEKYFTLLHKRILKAMDDEVDAEDITSIIKMEEFKDRAMFKSLNAQNISDAYTEIEFAEEE